MPSNIITSNFRCSSAANFVSSISSSSVYTYIGRHYAWDGQYSDLIPPTPTDTDTLVNADQFKQMIAVKKIREVDVSIAVRRYNWTSGIKYIRYSKTDADILKKEFYVYTPDGNVYKCIDNRNNQGVEILSTIMPDLLTKDVFQTSDGYKWKYMYTISGDIAEKFLTPKFMYCPNSSIDSNVDSVNNTENMPDGGHASNIPKELGAYYVIVAARFEGDEVGKLPTNIDYRAFGIVRNLTLQTNGNSPATADFYNMRTRVRFNVAPTGAFVIGQQVSIQSQTNFNSYVIGTGTEGAQQYVDLVGHNQTITVGSVIQSGSTSGVASSIVSSPLRYRGDVLSVEYRSPIQRSPGQVEALNIVLEF
jgi:hypothetical protein